MRSQHVEVAHHGIVGIRVFLRHLISRHALTFRRRNDFVVNVGDILDMLHFIAAIREVTADHVHCHEQAGMADVRLALRRHAAHVHLDVLAVKGRKRFSLTAKRVGYAKRHGISPASPRAPGTLPLFQSAPAALPGPPHVSATCRAPPPWDRAAPPARSRPYAGRA